MILIKIWCFSSEWSTIKTLKTAISEIFASAAVNAF